VNQLELTNGNFAVLADSTMADVTVNAGQDTDLGTIVLESE